MRDKGLGDKGWDNKQGPQGEEERKKKERKGMTGVEKYYDGESGRKV